MTVIYLHGFASSGTSSKVDDLRKAFGADNVVAPDLKVEPLAAIQQIKELVHRLYEQGERKFVFVGTSMGGFYAWYCGTLFDAPAVMINPAVEPHVTSSQFLGMNTNMSTGVEFEWTEEHVEQLRVMHSWVVANHKSSLVTLILAMNDDLISSQRTVELFAGKTANTLTFETGGHRFVDFSHVVPVVEKVVTGIKDMMLDI